jgi:superfamily II DNA or RNA helicase/HKD family nuclease
LYERLVDDELGRWLNDIDKSLIGLRRLRPADAADRIAQYLGSQLEQAIAMLPEQDRVEAGVALARRLLENLVADYPKSAAVVALPVAGDVLHAVGRRQPDGSVRMPEPPLIPLLDTTLLTNAPGEPRVGSQVLAEINSADSIDVVMAFVRRSGLRPLQDALRRHCQDGKRLRVLTTTYTGSTEAAALELLQDLGAEVRVSYDATSTRLHAKAWLFRRLSSFTTAYVGSSNLTHSAQVAGMEWNVRVSAARNPHVVGKIEAIFDSYWEGGDFLPYVREEFAQAIERQQRDPASVAVMSPIEIRLEPFQERLLELIALSRERGHHRNLLVSATGTGKTVMAALDYARLRLTMPRARLLFVAHRDEILEQSRATFRHALRDYSFGEKWVGGHRPRHFDHVFASIQSLTAAGVANLEADYFDVVIVDEFHHAAARSYRQLLDHVQPKQLIGLTATPERADGMPILHWFDDRIAAELRIWDAIDQHYLTPFAYYGIHDGLDLRAVPWRRGQGYDSTALSGVYTGSDAWARFVIAQLGEHVDDVSSMRCLGFCVSVPHARFMADQFNAHGIDAIAVTGDSADDVRRDALDGLRDGRLQAVFSVDLFNEGVDVPAADVVLMLRPTESATLFLQQLGRGLRRANGKHLCTVLDFVGTHRREFRFDQRYRALLGGTRRDLERAVGEGFPFLPAGCHMQLDKVATEIVLSSVREAIPSRWAAKVHELRSLSRLRQRPTLAQYLQESGLELEDVYAGNRGWSDLCEAARLPVHVAGANEAALRRGISRMLHVDDDRRIDGYRRILSAGEPQRVDAMNVYDERLARMLAGSVAGQVLERSASPQEAVDLVWAHPQVRAELTELMDVLETKVDHIHSPIRDHTDVPLQVHARYTRIEILAAVGEGDGARTPQWREGVYDAKRIGADLLAFTLDKTSGEFSPTTRYRDYAVSRQLIHWESQSGTRANSPTGRRYQNHRSMGRSILLFARNSVDDRAFWFLGTASYVRHEGEKPMAVTWRLDTPLPGDLFASFAAAVA